MSFDKQAVTAKHQAHAGDTGSTKVQVACSPSGSIRSPTTSAPTPRITTGAAGCSRWSAPAAGC